MFDFRLQEIQNSKESGTEVESAISETINKSLLSMLLFETIVDETESQVLCLRMQSKIEESAKAPTILVIPGLEGFGKILEPLCLNLEAKIYALQLNYLTSPETIFDMVQDKLPVSSYLWPLALHKLVATLWRICIFQLAEQHLSKDKPFTIIAHSYGVVEALELVSILEDKGYFGTIYCIDGAPVVMNEFAENALGKSEDEIESNIILQILMQYNLPSKAVAEMSVSTNKQSWNKFKPLHCLNIFSFQLEFQKFKNVNEKIERTIELYGSLVSLSNDYLKRLILVTTKRVFAMKNYKCTLDGIKSTLLLFRPIVSTFRDTTEDYGLSAICKRPIQVYTLAGNHSTILKNEELAKIINSNL